MTLERALRPRSPDSASDQSSMPIAQPIRVRSGFLLFHSGGASMRLHPGAIVLACLCLFVFPQALAQTYPSRVVTIIVPFPAGGGHDFTARTIAARLVSRLGQQVVVENRGGAN